MPVNLSHRKLTRPEKVALGVAAGVVLLLAFNSLGGSSPPTASQPAPVNFVGAESAIPTTPAATVTYEEVEETLVIPFDRVSVDDPNLASGTTTVSTIGVPGQLTRTYRVTLTNGQESDRVLVSEIVTIPPVSEVTSLGTYVAPPPPAPDTSECDPNYGGCVPISSDVDCAGGSGNGPAYVEGPVPITGSDIYDLDRDGNGIGCD